jgi:hypothetical protein
MMKCYNIFLQRIEKTVGGGLSDGQWHTVVVRIGDDRDNVTLSVTHGDDSSSDTIGAEELGDLVRDLDLRSGNPQVKILSISSELYVSRYIIVPFKNRK